ncbi:MAG: RNA polymerase sigma factor [Bacteroidota bacterium]|nr:RNA polymerase sigma factor [Bacteroidota bacterium]
MDQTELIEQIKAGDHQAFRQLTEHYYPLVLKTSNSFVHNEEDAQDLSQEVFLEVYQSIHKFRKEAVISTWIYRITINKSLNFIRDRKRKQFWGSLDMLSGKTGHKDENLLSNPGDNPGDIEIIERKRILYNSVENLPKNQRIAFTLNKMDEMPYKQVAEVMDVSLSSVESLIHRARKNLQERLYKYYRKD